ncbi:cytochrome P450 [Mycobacterium nebraskense]|uniref:Cytochrome n=1 Tax=Mycobacterium nebraskense TaxID=244292 RepID=A0A0F5NCN0_9MYCO|nr:cytochrome P450 [Mycobacterium nebraskense]KKC04645.1 cytochrome P450 [Mycobacterium nebraskense]KLO44125.1 cytochrome P450 [Mycobacterium nebraskense]MBI2696301.1 cytochrome P450 [Mycobacterium nebraskense]MCV7119718.1 cytochrome P450 [Mycobacterium nebraskense]ORW28394.1 cytochrome [Mycobacterium nebraskense]
MKFAYDPFDAEVMANPLPYYRVLRDHHPVYYMPQWDTFALSRFEDIWQVLEVNDGTFVASEGTLPPASVLAKHNTGPVDDPPLHPLPFHAVFDTDLYAEIRRAHSQPLRPRAVTGWEARIRELANERLDELLPRGSFDLTQDYGGIVVASVVCELLGISTDLAPQVLAAVNAGSLAEPGVGVDTAEARPNYFEYLLPSVRRRRADQSGGPLAVVDGLLGYRLPDGSPLDDVEVATQMLCIFIGGTETVPKIVAHGLWELGQRPDQMAAVRADPENNVPIAREEMIRFCAPAQWFARTARKPFTIHGETIRPGQRVITLLASANRDEREYPEPDEFIWDRPIRRSLAFGRGQHFCIGYHLARLEVAVLLQEWLRRVPEYAIQAEAARRLPSSFQWGWNNIPVEV